MANHISAKRVATSKELVLWKKLKKPFKQVKALSCRNTLIELFKYCYPNLWRDVCEYHEEISKWNASRIRKNLSAVYECDSPEHFLENHSKVKAETSIASDKSQEEIKALVEAIRKKSLSKLNSRIAKDSKRERYIQHTQPLYVAQHIKAYYNTRRLHPEDIDTRYLIVHELAKYKCDDTISFLIKLVRCEKNRPLQHYAWQKLNDFGVIGVHKGYRKGKKKLIYTRYFNG